MHTARSRAAVISSGLLSLVGILIVLVGIPAALWIFGGNPLPNHLPSIAEITARLASPDDGTLFMGILTIVGWVAWATFALSLLVAIPAQLRGLPAPRLPGLSWQQGRASVMVAAVAAMFALIASGGISTAPAAHAAPATTTTSTATATATAVAPLAATTSPVVDDATPPAPASKVVTVESGDTLWGIATEELGDGARYPEIVDATTSTIQPDGQHLTNPDLIHPGWQVTVPGVAAQPDTTPAPAPTPSPEPAAPSGSSTTQATPQTPGDSIPSRPDLGAGDTASSGVASTTPDDPASAPATPGNPLTTGAGSTATVQASDTTDGGYLPAALTAAGLGSLAAAGLLAWLKRRRDRQSRRRQPGRRIALPTGPAAVAEAQLRVAADPLAATDLNRALRTLAHHAHTLEAPMPALRAARITHDTLELYLVDDGVELPAPFTTTPTDPGTWTLRRGDLSVLLDDATAATIPAPYPSLVTVGHDEDQAHLLLNLEELGALALTGDAALAQEVLTALAIELITSTWTDDSRITLVGVLPELVSALASDRTTYVENLEQIITSLEYTAAVHRDALREHHQEGATQARAAGLVDETWTPHLILVGTDLTQADRARITTLLQDIPRIALATITTGGPAVGEWSLHLTRDASGNVWADLSPVPVRVTPQRLPETDYRATLDLFAVTEEDATAGPDWTEGIADGDALTIADLPQPQPLEEGDIVDDAAAPAPAFTPASDLVDEEETHEILPVAPRLVSALVDDTAPDDAQDSQERAEDELVDVDEQQSEPLPAEGLDESPVDAALPAIDDELPLITVLGPVGVSAARGQRPESYHRILEVLTYLALHPGQSPAAFNEAIFPGQRINGQKRNTYMAYARRWLGNADDGHPFVGLVPETGYALAKDAQLDWALFQTLIGSSIGEASTERLKAALELVHGEPLSGVDATRYEWAQPVKTEIIAAVADVAHEVARRATIAGDPRTAAWAATKGLAAEPVNEALWRDAITAAWQSGIPGRARDLISRCHSTMEDLGDLEDETITLINDIIRGERQRAYA